MQIRLFHSPLAQGPCQLSEEASHHLVRVLRAERFWVPQWYKATHTIAYYDLFEHPPNLPPYALGELSFWWYNAEKSAALRAAGALR